jgi:hypothetical protein
VSIGNLALGISVSEKPGIVRPRKRMREKGNVKLNIFKFFI